MSRHTSLFPCPEACSHSAKPPLSPSFHPHSFVSEIRSVPGGCSRFSRCCYLIIDLSTSRPTVSVGVGPQELVAVTWTRRLGSAVRTETPYATARIAFWLLRNGSPTSH